MNEDSLEKELIQLRNDAVDFRITARDTEYINNMAHYEGLQWNLAQNKDNSPFMLKSDINHLKNAVDLRLGSLFSESYYGELQPLSPNDVDDIATLNLLYRNEWSRLNADDRVEAAVKNGALQDNGYTEISFDSGAIFGGTGTRREGSIVLKDLCTTDVYLDPKANSIDDCEYLVVKSKKTKYWLKRNKPEWLKILQDKNITPGVVANSDDGNIYTGRYFSKSSNNLYDIDTIYRKYTEEIEINEEDDEGNPVLNEETGEPLTEKVAVTRVKVHYLINDQLVETNEDYPFDEFPIIAYQWQPEPQSPYGIPLLRGLTVPQKVANLIESAANNIAMHYATPTWLVSEESGLDINKVAKLSNALGMVWKVSGNVGDAIAQMPYPKVDEQMINIKNSFVDNIQQHAGITATYIGSIGTAGSTAEGTSAAINRAMVIDNAPIKQIEIYVEKLSRMIIKFMTRYYRNQKIYIRNTKKLENGNYTFKDFLMKESFQDINYDFTVKLASRSKSDKNRQYNIMKDLYTTQNQYKESKKVINITDLVKAAQLDNYDEMFKRFSDMSDEAFNEKADLIVQIMNIGQTITPNGQPLITAEEMQQGILDVLNDDGDLSVVEQIFNTYEEYQTAITNMKNQLIAKAQQTEINALNQDNQNLQNQMQQGMEQMINQGNEEQNVDNALSELGL
jgi:hypothetical protein